MQLQSQKDRETTLKQRFAHLTLQFREACHNPNPEKIAVQHVAA
jgi:hypothetical protein